MSTITSTLNITVQKKEFGAFFARRRGSRTTGPDPAELLPQQRHTEAYGGKGFTINIDDHEICFPSISIPGFISASKTTSHNAVPMSKLIRKLPYKGDFTLVAVAWLVSSGRRVLAALFVTNHEVIEHLKEERLPDKVKTKNLQSKTSRCTA